MEEERFDVNNTQVQLVMVIKLQQLQREAIPALSYRNLEDFLEELKWRRKHPSSLHEAVNDVLSVQPDAIIRFLSRQAVIQGQRAALADFSDLIGGN